MTLESELPCRVETEDSELYIGIRRAQIPNFFLLETRQSLVAQLHGFRDFRVFDRYFCPCNTRRSWKLKHAEPHRYSSTELLHQNQPFKARQVVRRSADKFAYIGTWPTSLQVHPSNGLTQVYRSSLGPRKEL